MNIVLALWIAVVITVISLCSSPSYSQLSNLTKSIPPESPVNESSHSNPQMINFTTTPQKTDKHGSAKLNLANTSRSNLSSLESEQPLTNLQLQQLQHYMEQETSEAPPILPNSEVQPTPPPNSSETSVIKNKSSLSLNNSRYISNSTVTEDQFSIPQMQQSLAQMQQSLAQMQQSLAQMQQSLAQMQQSLAQMQQSLDSGLGKSNGAHSDEISSPISLKVLSSDDLVLPVDLNPKPSVVDEPSIASDGNIIFYAGNWYAARNEMGNPAWQIVSPFADMGFHSTGLPRFCCDQDVVYDNRSHLFLWYRQATKNPLTGEGFFRLGVSSDADNWKFYDVRPQDIISGDPQSSKQWWDLPQLALSDKFLYIKTNLYQSDSYKGTVIMRLALIDLADRIDSPTVDYYVISLESGGFNFVPVQGATNTMYFAAQLSNDRIRIYEWKDDVDSQGVRSFDRAIPPFTLATRGQIVCKSPDGLNWCGRADYRMIGGYISGNNITFYWNAGQDESVFKYPYVEAATFRTDDMEYVGRPLIWSSSNSWIYGYMVPNGGNVGMAAFYGNSEIFPSVAVGIKNTESDSPSWKVQSVGSGELSPSSNKWGDYLRLRSVTGMIGDSNSIGWIGSGFILKGSPEDPRVKPFYYLFTLDNNAPASMPNNLYKQNKIEPPVDFNNSCSQKLAKSASEDMILANSDLANGNLISANEKLLIASAKLGMLLNGKSPSGTANISCKPTCDSCGPGGGYCCGIKCSFATIN